MKKGNYYHFALPIEDEANENLSGTLNNIKLSVHSLHELSRKLNLRSISILFFLPSRELFLIPILLEEQFLQILSL